MSLFTYFCAHPTNLRQSGKYSQQLFTKPGKVSLVIPCSIAYTVFVPVGISQFTSPHILAHMLKASNCSQRLLSPTNVLTTQALFPWDLGVKKGQTMKREKERGERTTSQCGRKNNLSLHGVPSISYRWLHCMIALTDNIDMQAVPDDYLKLWRWDLIVYLSSVYYTKKGRLQWEIPKDTSTPKVIISFYSSD